MKLKNFIIGFLTQLYSIFIILKNIFKKRETLLYPENPVYLSPRYRGRVVLTKDPQGNDRCVACNLCSAVCPVDCISVQKTQDQSGRWFPKFFRVNFSRCIFCGLCEEACPTTAIQLIPDFELSDFNRRNLVYEKNELSITGTGKNHHYNFYDHCGLWKDKKNHDLDNVHITPVNVKDLLL